MNWKINVLFFIGLSFLIACDSRENESNREKIDDITVEKTKPNSDFRIETEFNKISFDDFEIDQFKHRMNISDFVLYGSFYDNAALKIYKLKNLHKLKELDYMYGIYLYFVDDVLVRKQAYLFDNQFQNLMSNFGKAKLTIRDEKMKYAYESEVLSKKQSLISFLKSTLGFYEFNWLLNDMNVKYVVNEIEADDQLDKAIKSKDYFDAPYKLVVESKDFDEIMMILNYKTK